MDKKLALLPDTLKYNYRQRKTLPFLLVLCNELSCSLQKVSCGRRGSLFFKFHLGTLSTTFPLPRLGQLTCQPAHYRAERPLSVQSLLQVSHLPHDSELQTALSVALCSTVEEERRRVMNQLV